MNTRHLSASIALAILFSVLSVPAQAQNGPPPGVGDLQARVRNLEDMVVALQAQVANLQAQIAAGVVPNLPSYLTVDTTTHNVLFSGVNVQVVNGTGATDTINGLGNVIVGYNSDRVPSKFLVEVCSDGTYVEQAACEAAGQVWAWSHKTGSHNIVGGDHNSYSSYGGLIVGFNNAINNRMSSVAGGDHSIASGMYSSVSGGLTNTASGSHSSVSGGRLNQASGDYSSVTGGTQNTASSYASSVSGGDLNTASGPSSSVSGGENNTAGVLQSSVSGGVYNQASGRYSSVSGGNGCEEGRDLGWSVGTSDGSISECIPGN